MNSWSLATKCLTAALTPLHSSDFIVSRIVSKVAVLGDIFEVSSSKWCPVKIGSRAIDHRVAAIETLFSHQLAATGHEVGTPRVGDHLSGVAAGIRPFAEGKPSADAIDAIACLRLRLDDKVHGIHGIAFGGIADHVRDEDDADLVVSFPYPPCRLETIDSGHFDVHEKEVEGLPGLQKGIGFMKSHDGEIDFFLLRKTSMFSFSKAAERISSSRMPMRTINRFQSFEQIKDFILN